MINERRGRSDWLKISVITILMLMTIRAFIWGITSAPPAPGFDGEAFVADSLRWASGEAFPTSDVPLRYLPLIAVYSITNPSFESAAQYYAVYHGLLSWVLLPLSVGIFVRAISCSRHAYLSILVLCGLEVSQAIAPVQIHLAHNVPYNHPQYTVSAIFLLLTLAILNRLYRNHTTGLSIALGIGGALTFLSQTTTAVALAIIAGAVLVSVSQWRSVVTAVPVSAIGISPMLLVDSNDLLRFFTMHMHMYTTGLRGSLPAETHYLSVTVLIVCLFLIVALDQHIAELPSRHITYPAVFLVTIVHTGVQISPIAFLDYSVLVWGPSMMVGLLTIQLATLWDEYTLTTSTSATFFEAR